MNTDDTKLAPFRKLSPIPAKQVTIDDAFWKPRIAVNHEVTLRHELGQIRETGRLDNFLKAAGRVKGEFRGFFFDDSDVHKWVEAAAWSLGSQPDPALEAELDEVIDAIASAQQPDGYLNSYFTLREPGRRWKDLGMMHELYCAGHLIEAGVAHFEATGKRTLLDVAVRLADCIDGVFGRGKRRGCCGHEEIELALVKLYRATREERYLRLAEFFIDTRGQEPNTFLLEAKELNRPFDPAYCQAHKPVREQTEVVGHAVRAMYLYCAMADVYMETGDASLLDALERLWSHLAFRRTYVTGGIGSSSRNEGFTRDYDLPNESAYAETCASIGSFFWNHRMLLITGAPRFGDVMERALYNAILSGVGLDGKSFFYENPLRSLGGKARLPWYGCACCPPNIARLLASLSGYVYSQSASGIYVHLYVGSRMQTRLDGAAVTLRQETVYPWDGAVRFTLGLERPGRFGLYLRIPSWCRGASVSVNGKPASGIESEGFVTVTRTWADGDVLELTLPMGPQRVEASPHVEADFGRLALQRGPLVYCLEEADNGAELFQLSLPASSPVKHSFRKDLLGGVVVLEALAERPDVCGWENRLYRAAAQSGTAPHKITAVPYCCWANRGPGEMLVWLLDAR